jgi:hypothetical protein
VTTPSTIHAPGRPSLIGCSVGFAALAATLGAVGGIFLGLALGRPVAECDPLARSGLLLGALLGLLAALVYAGTTREFRQTWLRLPRIRVRATAGCSAVCSCVACTQQ